MVRLIVLLVLTATGSTSAQGRLQCAYGGIGDEVCQDCIALEDGAVLVGQTTTFGAGTYDFLAIRTDLRGVPLWCATYGGPGEDIALGCAPTLDGGVIMTGYSQNYGAGFSDILVVRTDRNGIPVWSKSYGDQFGSDWGRDICPTNDEGYILTGHIISDAPQNGHDLCLIKIDEFGDIQWAKIYGDEFINIGNEVIQTSDGGYLVAGITHSQHGGPSNLLLIRTDTAGLPLWTQSISCGSWMFGHVVREVSDGYIAAGYGYSLAFNSEDMLLIKTSLDGEIVFSKVYGTNQEEQIRDLCVDQDGSITATGLTNGGGSGQTDFILLHLDASGEPLWTQLLGGDGFDNAFTVRRQQDAYLVAGYTASFGFGGTDMYLVRTDLDGKSGCNEISFAMSVADFTFSTAPLDEFEEYEPVVHDVAVGFQEHSILSESLCCFQFTFGLHGEGGVPSDFGARAQGTMVEGLCE